MSVMDFVFADDLRVTSNLVFANDLCVTSDLVFVVDFVKNDRVKAK